MACSRTSIAMGSAPLSVRKRSRSASWRASRRRRPARSTRVSIWIRAGRDVVQQGSDLSAGYDINVQAGRDILIDAAGERSVSTHTESQERTGTTTHVNHNAGSTMDALQGAGKRVRTASARPPAR